MFYKQALHCIAMIIVVLLGQAQVIKAQGVAVLKWKVEKNSTLHVKGKSNVNSFTCTINEYTKNDTLILSNDVSKSLRLRGEIKMDVLKFDCHSGMLTKGLRQTLKADDYPTMMIRFLSLERIPAFLTGQEVVNGLIEVELAGAVKRFELTYSFRKNSGGNIQLDGGRTFCFSDFHLSPPKKFGGLIKIKDEFVVQFQLLLRPVQGAVL